MNKFNKHLQKYFYTVFLIPILTIGTASCAQQQQNNNRQGQVNPTQIGQVAIKNGSFEDGISGWSNPDGAAKIVSDIHHSGSYSLHYKNTDPEKYRLFTQAVDAQPGQKIHFSVWVRGVGIQEVGKEDSKAGAGIFMESSSGSTYLGGTYGGTKNGTFDWTQLTGDYVIPLNATRTVVGVYLRASVTGEAWFDDVEVVAEAIVPFKSTLQFPNYRGIVKKGNISPWKVGIQINENPDWKSHSAKVTYTLIDAKGKVLLEKAQNINSAETDVTLIFQPPKNLQIGKYTLRQNIINPNGIAEPPSEFPINVVKEMPPTYIDEKGFTVVDGKRFFPNGFFIGNSDEGNLKRIADGGYNTILAYSYGSRKDPEDYLERAQKANLKVVYSVKDMYPGKGNQGEEAFDMAADYIKRVYDKPSLLGWYTNDEMGASWAAKIQKMYDQIQQLDTIQHPVYQVVMIGDLEQASHSGDVLGTDPYPVRGDVKELLQTTLNTRVTAKVANGVKGVWIVPQIFDHAVYTPNRKPNPPTLDEMRNQAYQAIIGGATGLIWYSYFDLFYDKYPKYENPNSAQFHRRWKEISAMGHEINKITPVVLKDQKVLLDLPEKAEVEAAAWQDGNELLIMLASPYYEEKSISFALPAGWKIKDAEQGQIKSTFANGKATFTLPSVGSGVFRLVKN